MTTLIERLRVRNMMLCDEAADELEQLQTSLVRLKMRLDQQREYHAAELADVVAERDHAVEQAATNADEVLALRAERDALREDAERYRWLRDQIYIDPKMLILRINNVFLRGPLPEALDAAIDAARKATP